MAQTKQGYIEIRERRKEEACLQTARNSLEVIEYHTPDHVGEYEYTEPTEIALKRELRLYSEKEKLPLETLYYKQICSIIYLYDYLHHLNTRNLFNNNIFEIFHHLLSNFEQTFIHFQ